MALSLYQACTHMNCLKILEHDKNRQEWEGYIVSTHEHGHEYTEENAFHVSIWYLFPHAKGKRKEYVATIDSLRPTSFMIP